MPYYFVNMDQTQNPGLHHEVHKPGCYWGDKISQNKRKDLGYCTDEIEAVQKAKVYYSDADGCADCCPKAHRG